MRARTHLCIAINLSIAAGCSPSATTQLSGASLPPESTSPPAKSNTPASAATNTPTAILPPTASPISIEQMSRYPPVGVRGPRKISYSPDGTSITYLQGETSSPVMSLFAFDTKTREAKIILRADDFSKTQSREPRPMSREEELRRERQRVRTQGITAYAWAERAPTLLIPFNGDVFLRAADGALIQLTNTNEPEIDPQICATGERVAFARGREIYSIDVAARRETQLTKGAPEGVTRGQSDFNAQEEFDEPSGLWISPTCDKIAYLEVDEREVTSVAVSGYRGGKSDVMMQKYPQPGGKNPAVRAGVIDLKTQKTTWIKWPSPEEKYLGRFVWSRDGKALYAQSIPRDQRRLSLSRIDPATGEAKAIINDTSPTWIDFAQMRLLEKSPWLLWTRDIGGHIHVELRDAVTGATIRGLTSGDWDVDAIGAVDEERGAALVTATKDGPLERHLYSVGLGKPGDIKRLTTEEGVHFAIPERSGRGFVDVGSSLTRTPKIVVRDTDGAALGELPMAVDPELAGLKLRAPEIIEVKGPSGDTLYGSLLKPRSIEPGRRYPVVVMVYGGPGYQTVMNQWQPSLLWNHLADRGVAVFQLDNRGTPGRGTAFEGALYGHVGEVELADQIAGLDAIAKLPFIDSSRVGVFGKSYGGTMTLVALLKAPDRFKVGVAGAPVTDFRLYDSGYTERFLGPLSASSKAYETTDLTKLAPNLRGKLLLMHGMMDENVHFQNTAQLIDALIQANKPFDMLLLPGERHGTRDPATRRYETQRALDYLTEHL